MPRNTSGLRRGGPGRPKGRKNKIPSTFKQALQGVFETIHANRPELIQDAIEAGLKQEKLTHWSARCGQLITRMKPRVSA